MKITKLVCTLTLAICPLVASAQDASVSLVENGSFKKEGKGWESIIKEDSGKVAYIQDDISFARLTPTKSVSPNILITQRSFVPTGGGEFIGSAKIRVSADYDLDKAPVVYFNVQNPPGTEPRSQQYNLKLSEFADANKWVEVTLPVTIPAGSPRVWIQCAAFGKAGTADFTEVSLKAK